MVNVYIFLFIYVVGLKDSLFYPTNLSWKGIRKAVVRDVPGIIQLNIERRQNYCFTNYSLGHTY